MSILEKFAKNKPIKKITTEEIKEEKPNIFDISKKIYKLNNADEVDGIIDNLSDSDLSFLVWLLLHNLCYNKTTRMLEDTIVKMSYGCDSKEFIKWFVSFIIYNKIFFPNYMPWYKFGKNEDKYKDLIEEEYDISEEELEDIEKTFAINIKEIKQLD